MRTSLKKKLLGTAAGLSLLVVVFSVVTLIRARRTFAAPYPDLHASQDPAIIERGRYLVEGAAHCAECHGAPGRPGESRHGKPLTGSFEFKLPIGTFRVPNITPDSETGIGRLSDREIARLLRHGVRPDGRLTLPFMPFANLSDDDLTAILSYLRAQNPVRHQVAKHDINALGEIVLAYVIQPKGPSEAIRKSVAPEPTAAYGRYLTHNVGNCIMCHTKVARPFAQVRGSEPHARSALGLDQRLDGRSVRRTLPRRPRPRRFPDALGGLPGHDRRRSARDLPLLPHAAPGPGRPGSEATRGGRGCDAVTIQTAVREPPSPSTRTRNPSSWLSATISPNTSP
jgi:mono/diheme cytochrome c family protein